MRLVISACEYDRICNSCVYDRICGFSIDARDVSEAIRCKWAIDALSVVIRLNKA